MEMSNIQRTLWFNVYLDVKYLSSTEVINGKSLVYNRCNIFGSSVDGELSWYKHIVAMNTKNTKR